jgi:hypothetical protein
MIDPPSRVNWGVLALERMWRLPVRLPPPAGPVVSSRGQLSALRRRLNRESKCFVCRRGFLTWPRTRCYVSFLGVWLHFTGDDGSSSPCWETLRALGKDFSRSRRGRWRSKWDILARVAAQWR